MSRTEADRRTAVALSNGGGRIRTNSGRGAMRPQRSRLNRRTSGGAAPAVHSRQGHKTRRSKRGESSLARIEGKQGSRSRTEFGSRHSRPRTNDCRVPQPSFPSHTLIGIRLQTLCALWRLFSVRSTNVSRPDLVIVTSSKINLFLERNKVNTH